MNYAAAAGICRSSTRTAPSSGCSSSALEVACEALVDPGPDPAALVGVPPHPAGRRDPARLVVPARLGPPPAARTAGCAVSSLAPNLVRARDAIHRAFPQLIIYWLGDAAHQASR